MPQSPSFRDGGRVPQRGVRWVLSSCALAALAATIALTHVAEGAETERARDAFFFSNSGPSRTAFEEAATQLADPSLNEEQRRTALVRLYRLMERAADILSEVDEQGGPLGRDARDVGHRIRGALQWSR